MAADVMSAKEAAEYLGVTTRRIRQMLNTGSIHAVRDEPILLSRLDVEHVAHVHPDSPGRPVMASKAWDEISAFRLDNFANETVLDSWRRKMRPRADWQRFRVHRSVLRDLIESPLLVASGLRAAANYGVPVEPDERRFVGYVAASDLDQVPVGLPVRGGDSWNVELGVVADSSWRFGRSASFVDPVTAWLDLEDHRHRSAQLMLEVVLGSRD